jgi:hypothetical protein
MATGRVGGASAVLVDLTSPQGVSNKAISGSTMDTSTLTGCTEIDPVISSATSNAIASNDLSMAQAMGAI